MHHNNFGNFYTREIYAIPIPIGFIPIPIPIMSRLVPFPWDSDGNGIPMVFRTPMHTSSITVALAHTAPRQAPCLTCYSNQ